MVAHDKSIRMHRIDACTHPLYEEFRKLYRQSFPVFEQRTPPQQRDAFVHDAYRLLAYTENGLFLGFIACWELATCRYLAVNDLLRGRGYGSRLLGDFVRAPGKPVLLEIDPVTDDVSAARLRFYQKCGFVENPYAHRHPPYRAGFAPHLLVVLTSGRAISEEEYQRFDDDLRNVVMNFTACRRPTISSERAAELRPDPSLPTGRESS